MSLVLQPAMRNASFQILFKCFTLGSLLTRCTIPCARHAKRHLNAQKWSEHVVFLNILTWKCASRHNGVHFFDISTSKSGPSMVCFVHFDFQMCFASQLPKVVREWCALGILTWKCASRHNGVHFFDISTSKSGPHLVCFVHFDFQTCFAPQRRALFEHLNFQRWSKPGVLCTF